MLLTWNGKVFDDLIGSMIPHSLKSPCSSVENIIIFSYLTMTLNRTLEPLPDTRRSKFGEIDPPILALKLKRFFVKFSKTSTSFFLNIKTLVRVWFFQIKQ